MDPNVYRKLKVREAAEYLGLSKSTLDKLRVHGGGPFYLRLGRRVVYDLTDLEAWAAKGRRSHTSEGARSYPPEAEAR